ncbi:PASTA domain-containing protein [Arthrobacter alpinus]|uniref:PASTA domain-containing protein n=1 Tax=Arthrobacter alpinus TaxID=656366 RepID=A0A1H5IQ29_9MICC|nr:PASTA domain-containing protein [Arthrobacter alpinus]SEE42275.1 PASTA domain-containing protein [Arthrobacter alpinus]
MKKFIQFSVLAMVVAGLAACSTNVPTTIPDAAPSASATSTASKRPVPDVVGLSYKEAYETLVKDDFYAQLVDETGSTWTTGSPWNDVKVASTDPAAGTITDVSYVNVQLEITQAEYAEQTKAAK